MQNATDFIKIVLVGEDCQPRITYDKCSKFQVVGAKTYNPDNVDPRGLSRREMGVLKVERKVVKRFVCYFADVHHFDVILNRVHLVKVNARLRVELLAWPGRVDSNGVLDNFFPWICF
jgi:hypothetical protein